MKLMRPIFTPSMPAARKAMSAKIGNCGMLHDRGTVGMKKKVRAGSSPAVLTVSMAAPTTDTSGVHSPPLAWRDPVFCAEALWRREEATGARIA